MASGSSVKRDLQQGDETAEWQHFREEITCSICGDIFTDPKTIVPCLHTFCKRCIENSIESNKKMSAVVCCPLCRTPLSQGEITSIPSNFTISRLVEIFMQREQEKGEVSVTISRLVEIFGQQQKVGTTASVETTCGNCEENLPVTVWCTECEDPLCHDCSELHKKIKAYKSHEVILINQFLSDPKQVLRIAISEKVDFCKIHINQMVDHYCKTCSKLVCQECVSQGRPLGHRYHSVSSVEDVLDEKQERIKEILVPLKQLLKQMRNGVKKIERCEDQIDKESEASIEKIRATYDEQYRILKQQEEDAIENVHIIQDSLKNTLALQKKNVQLTESQMASCIDFYENIVKISRAKELIHYNDWIENRVVELNNKMEHTSLDPQCKAIHMAVKCKPVVNESLCDVSSVPICKVMEGPAVIDRLIKLTVTLKDHSAAAVPIVNQSKDIEIHCNKEKKFLQKKQVKEQLEGQYEIRYNPKRMECHLLCIRWRGIAMNHEKIQVLVNVRDYSSIKEVVMVINSYGPIDIDPYGGGLMNRQLANPCFLAKGPDNKLYVRDSNCDVLVVFDEQYQYSHIIGGHGRGLGRFLCMTGIAVDKKGYLYIADRELHCIQKLNQRSGKFICQIGSKGSADGKFNCPSGLLFASGLLFVCDLENHRIQVFKDEQFFYCFGKCGAEPGAFNHPINLTMNNNEDQLFITDLNNHRIQLFTPKGQFLKIFCNFVGIPYKIFYPSGIHYTPDGHLLVCAGTVNSVLVFQEDGKFISSIDGFHQDRRYFFPCGVLMMDNGQIVIASSSDHQLVIF